MSKPKISFIICTYNRAEYLQDSVETLLQNEANPEYYQLLIIDNNSADETKAIVQEAQASYPDHNISYITETKQGLSHARNRGIEESDCPIIVFVDDDVMVPENYIDSWLEFWKMKPNAKCAGGKIEVQFDDPRPSWMSYFLLPLLGHHDNGSKLTTYGKNAYPFGGNMGFKSSIFDQFGNFDTELGRKGKELKASEEKELFQRIKKAGVGIFYVPKAKLFHRVNKSRLTEEYIKEQAIGLGESIAIQNRHKSSATKLSWAITEFLKWMTSLLLFLPYTLSLQTSKAVMLLKFRRWILDGYQSFEKNN